MSVKDDVLYYLQINRGEILSGERAAKELGVSRNAVFKAINLLRGDGYDIMSSQKGYMLPKTDNRLGAAGIIKRLKSDKCKIHLYNEVSSTNTVIKRLAEEGAPEWSVCIAEKQSAGRGRLGKSFLSPLGTGIYMSILLRPDMPAENTVFITVAAAVAAARAIERTSGKRAEIKWVNDIYIDERKVCGILTEASFDTLSEKIEYAVLGIGINVAPPDGGFDNSISGIAGAMLDVASADIRERTIADFINEFSEYYAAGTESAFDEYRKRQYLIGRMINVSRAGTTRRARALYVDETCRLCVRYEDGSTELISSGEVSTSGV